MSAAPVTVMPSAVSLGTPVAPTTGTLPTATAAPSSATGGPQQAPGALAGIVARVKDVASSIYKQQKPWSEVLDKNALSKPANFTEALGRIKKNAAYFKLNYLLVVVASCLVTFIFNPTSLFVLAALLGAWVYLFFVRTAPLVIGGRQLSDREKVLGLAAISFITVFFLTSVGAEFFSAISFGLAVILLHGAFREPDNLFVDDQEAQPILFNILPSSTPAAPSGLAV